MSIVRALLVTCLACAILALGLIWALQAPGDWVAAGALRTPEAAFEKLPDYPFRDNYADIAGYRLHYVDEGPRYGPVILLLHGVPTWSYTYRRVIPQLAEEGYRVVAPDMIGFGKSDKPARSEDFSYQMQIDTLADLVKQLELTDITLFGQDWGGMIGLRLAAREPERYARIAIANCSLPAARGIAGWTGYPLFRYRLWRQGPVSLADLSGNRDWVRLAAFARASTPADVGAQIQAGTVTRLPAAVLAGYGAPFPDDSFMAGPRAMPALVETQLRQNARVWRGFLAIWQKPFLTVFSETDPMTEGGDALFKAMVPGAEGQAHELVAGAGHFLPEDQPDQLVDILLDFIERQKGH